jgi:hypothetical protein
MARLTAQPSACPAVGELAAGQPAVPRWWLAWAAGVGATAAMYALAGLSGRPPHVLPELSPDRWIGFHPGAVWVYLSFFLFQAVGFYCVPPEMRGNCLGSLHVLAHNAYPAAPTGRRGPCSRVCEVGGHTGQLPALPPRRLVCGERCRGVTWAWMARATRRVAMGHRHLLVGYCYAAAPDGRYRRWVGIGLRCCVGAAETNVDVCGCQRKRHLCGCRSWQVSRRRH